jgi:hypothetical protein
VFGIRSDLLRIPCHQPDFRHPTSRALDAQSKKYAVTQPRRSGARPGFQCRRRKIYWLELLVDVEIVPAAKTQPVRRECDELIAIFVTILKRSKQA